MVARDTDAEAEAEAAHLQALVDAERRPEISGGTDPKTQMYKVLADTSRVGSNGGTLAGLVGSYDQVAERIAAFHDAGIELFMLQFQPLEAELDRFAEHIIPQISLSDTEIDDPHIRCSRPTDRMELLAVGRRATGPAHAHRRDVARRRRRPPSGSGCCSTTQSQALRRAGVLSLAGAARATAARAAAFATCCPR